MPDSDYTDLARQTHAECVVCGGNDPLDLHLRFLPGNNGEMTVVFPNRRCFQGYPGQLHGGIIATLFDTAMTHCLFADGKTGVTGELRIRYLHPVISGHEVCVRVNIERHKLHLSRLSGTLIQDGTVKARGKATFWLTGESGNAAAGSV